MSWFNNETCTICNIFQSLTSMTLKSRSTQKLNIMSCILTSGVPMTMAGSVPAISSGVIALFVFCVLCFGPWWPSREADRTETWSRGSRTSSEEFVLARIIKLHVFKIRLSGFCRLNFLSRHFSWGKIRSVRLPEPQLFFFEAICTKT
jgi:hypothetical protein